MESFGIAKSTLSRWLSRYDENNPKWYKTLPVGGSTGKMGAEMLRQLVEELNRGCAAHGFEGEVWTRGRVGVVIERLFELKYDPAHIGRLLKKAGWSLQRPSKQALQRSEERVQNWQIQRVPFKAEDFEEYFTWLTTEQMVDSKLLLVWDGASIHKGEAVKCFLRNNPGVLHLEALPPYCPQLNAIELLWDYLKCQNSKTGFSLI